VLTLSQFIEDVKKTGIIRVSGTAVFLNSDPNGTPIAMLHNIKHNKILHERNIIVTIRNEEIPHISDIERAKVEPFGDEFYRVVLRYGFMEDPDVPAALKSLQNQGLKIEPDAATYILSRNTLRASKGPGMALWRERLFTFMNRNASRPTEFFRLPANRVVELGMQIEI
jgi:KUP system potassium uptake protein